MDLVSIAKELGVPAATLTKSNKPLLDAYLAKMAKQPEEKPKPKKPK